MTIAQMIEGLTNLPVPDTLVAKLKFTTKSGVEIVIDPSSITVTEDKETQRLVAVIS